jgi:hypothetical protein
VVVEITGEIWISQLEIEPAKVICNVINSLRSEFHGADTYTQIRRHNDLLIIEMGLVVIEGSLH